MEFFKKIISVVLSALMIFFGIFIPGKTDPAKTISQGEWLTMVNEEFGMTSYDPSEPLYAGIEVLNPYYETVQIAYQWGVIDDNDVIDVDAPATTEFVVATLVRATNMEAIDGKEVLIKNADDLKYVQEIAIAVANRFVSLKLNNKFDICDILYDDAVELLKEFKEAWLKMDVAPTAEYAVEYEKDVKEIDSKDYVINGDKVELPENTDVKAGETIVLPQNSDNIGGAAFAVEKVSKVGDKTVAEGEEVAADKVIKKLTFEGETAPYLPAAQITDAEGNIIQKATDDEGLLDTLKDKLGDKLKNISFSVGPVNVRASINDNGFDIALGGNICTGVAISEAFSVSNLDVKTKFDGNLAAKDIKQAYILLDYDSVSTTAVSGSYLASLGTDSQVDTTGMSVMDQIKANFSNVTFKSNQIAKIPVFTVDIPIPNCPEITVSLDVCILFTINGQVQLVISSHNHRGYEIVNNKGRFINESSDKNIALQATGCAEATATLSLGVGVIGYNLMDVSINGGVGAIVFVNVVFPTKNGTQSVQTSEIPADIVAESVALRDDADEIKVNGLVQFYGILYVAVGQNSLMGSVGLSKAWNIFDRSSGIIYKYEF